MHMNADKCKKKAHKKLKLSDEPRWGLRLHFSQSVLPLLLSTWTVYLHATKGQYYSESMVQTSSKCKVS